MPTRPLAPEAIQENFVAHLRARLGLEDEAAAVAQLSDWLSSYQPGQAALARATTLPSLQRNVA